MENANQGFGPILILLALIVAFLYLHFTGGAGLTRLYLAAALTVVAVLLLVPSLGMRIPEQIASWMPSSKIELGLDLQGGTHLLMAVKLDEAVKTQLKRRGDDVRRKSRTTSWAPRSLRILRPALLSSHPKPPMTPARSATCSPSHFPISPSGRPRRPMAESRLR